MAADRDGEREKYERMWTFAAYRDDHATPHAEAAERALGLQPGASIIDFGAGAGYGTAWLAARGYQVLAVDFAGNAMAPAFAALPRLLADLRELPADLIADYGLCCDVMEHIAPDDVAGVLRNIRAATRRGTYFSISLRPDACGRLIGDTLHLTVRSTDWWVDVLRAHWQRVDVLVDLPGDRVDVRADGRAPSLG